MYRAVTIAILLSILFNFYSLQAQQYHFRSYSTEEGLPQSEIRSILIDSRGFLWLGTQAGLARYDGHNFKVFTPKNGLVGYYVAALAEDKQGNLLIGTQTGASRYDGQKFTPLKLNIPGRIIQMGSTPDGDVWAVIFNNGQIKFTHLQKDTFVDLATTNPKLLNKPPYSFFTKNRKQFYIYSPASGEAFELKNNQLVKVSLPKGIFDGVNVRNILYQDSKGHIWYRSFASNQLFRHDGTQSNEIKLPPTFTSNQIVSVYEDNNGHIWFGSNSSGCVRYDGKRFQLFNVTNGLPHNTISGFAQDREGNVWMGTNNSGYGVLKFSGERFVNFDQRDSLKSVITWSFHEDSQGQIWAGFHNQVSRFNGSNFENFTLNNSPNTRIFQFFELSDKKLQALTIQPSGIYQFNGKKFENILSSYPLPQPPSAMYQEKDTLWFTLISSGRIVKTYQGKIIEDDQWKSGQWPNNFIFAIKRDRQKNFWMNSPNGLAKYDGKKLTIYRKKDGLKSDFVIQTQEDKWGRIWLACSNGLMYHQDGKFVDMTDQVKLPSNVLYAMVTDQYDNLWAGHQSGVSKIQFDDNGNFKTATHYGKEEGFLAGEPNLAAAFKDSKNQLWFGGVKGISRYNAQADTLKNIAPIVNIAQMKLFLKPVPWDSAQYKKYHEGIVNWQAVPKNLRLPYFENNVAFDLEALCFHASEQVVFQWKLEGLDKEWSPETKSREAVYTNLAPGKYTFLAKAKNKEGQWSTVQKVTFEILKPFWAEWWFRVLTLLIIIGLIYLVFRWRINNIKKQKVRLEKIVEEKTAEVVKQKDEIVEKNEELTQYAEELMAQAETLKEANQEISRKNEDITASINYAERIQTAILPQIQRIKKAFPQSFVFFKPRDIVSGDFYYFNTLNQYHVLAAVDCTGHGVPGAFMSLIGNDLLNHIINERKIWQPDLILNELHQQVRTSLKQDRSDNRDGMDLSLVVIDASNHTLHFASAKGSLIYFQEHQMHQIKGDKLPIGGEQRESKREFTAHTVDLSKPTTFYLFSDGYADQFGGPNGKKFMITQFRQLLAEIHHHPMNIQQKKLEETLEDWMQGRGQIHRQLDDILVMGVKVSDSKEKIEKPST
ncbi:MAG TPA: hypothetical protein DCS93_20795 [Microscillaceae bacterium]|nr:hypothetical protein [Microscillaceae bacterium]